MEGARGEWGQACIPLIRVICPFDLDFCAGFCDETFKDLSVVLL